MTDEILRVPRGNDFRLRMKPKTVAPAGAQDFRDIDNLAACLVKGYVQRIPCDYTLTSAGDILIKISGTLSCTTYGIELTGTYEGAAWRYKDCKVFRIVDCNHDSNVTNYETFSPEEYVIEVNIFTSINETIVDVTQAEYDAMSEHDENTYYCIV